MIPRLVKTDTLASAQATAAVLHEMGCAFVEEQFYQRGSVPLMWLIASAGGTVAWVETNWENADEKAFSAARLGAFIRSAAHAYCFISEAWALSSQSLPSDVRDAITAYAEEHGLAGVPDEFRDDIAMITSFGRNGDVYHTQYKVTLRRPGGGLNFLGPRIDNPLDDLAAVRGRLWNLFEGRE